MITPPASPTVSRLGEPASLARLRRESWRARLIWRAATILISLIAFCGGVWALGLSIQHADAIAVHHFQVFWMFFALNEPIPLFIIACLGLISLRPPRRLFQRFSRLAKRVRMPPPRVVALVVFLLATAGTFFICLNYPLSMDEYTMDYQAQIFASGQLDQHVPAQWRPVANLVRPLFVDYGEASHSWYSVYLPCYSALRALFHLFEAPFLLNPLLAALTVIFLAKTAQNIWPQDRSIATSAALLLALSAQFLITAMTQFPLTAHLFCNVLWLYCFTRQGSKAWLWCPWIGALAIGLHEPVMHALFVAPFLIYILFTRRVWQTAYYAIIYGFACAGWFWWLKTWCADRLAESPLTLALGKMLSIQAASTELILSWTVALVPALAIYALARRRGIPPVIILGGIGAALTWIFYWFFPDNQGHGWGYRYFFPVLGSVVLLACAGLRDFASDFSSRRAQTLLCAGLVASFLLLGLRCWQVREATEPYVSVANFMAAQKADVLFVDTQGIPYGCDFIRNRPDMSNRPILVGAPIDEKIGEELAARYRIRLITGKEIQVLGY